MLPWSQYVLFIIFILLTGSSSDRPSTKKKEGLLVIPGVGRSDRLSTVSHNLRAMSRYLEGDITSWDCIVYVFTPRNDTEFWGSSKRLKFISSMCDIVENPNKRVAENMFMVHPTFVDRAYEHIFILFDDCKLVTGGSYYPLDKVLEIMKVNKLTVSSPRVS